MIASAFGCSLMFLTFVEPPDHIVYGNAFYTKAIQGLRNIGDQKCRAIGGQPTESLDELLQQHRDCLASVSSIEGEFVERVDQDAALLRSFPAGPGVKRLVAETMETNVRFLWRDSRFNVRYSIDVTNSQADENEPGYAPTQHIFDGNRTGTLKIDSASATIAKGSHGDLEHFPNQYLVHLGFVLGGRDSEISLDRALSRPDMYSVASHLEEIDGFPCHVVTSGWDTIWLDAQHGGCIRRRIFFRMSGPDDPGRVMWLTAARDFLEVTPGVWWPAEIERTLFVTNRSVPEHVGKVESVTRLSVSTLRVNEVDDSAFDLRFPPGTLVADPDVGAYSVPEGLEKLDQAIAEATPIVDGKVIPPTHPFVSSDYSQGSRRQMLLMIAINIALAAIVLFIFWRRRNQARPLDGDVKPDV